MSVLYHRHGGEITAIKAVAHATYRGVASWHFIGDVTWRDGSSSKDIEIAPFALCYDEANAEGARLHDWLNDYLGRVGEWHGPKRARDGRVYHWTPKRPDGREAIHRIRAAA